MSTVELLFRCVDGKGLLLGSWEGSRERQGGGGQVSFVMVTCPHVLGTLPASFRAPSWGWGLEAGSYVFFARATWATDSHVFSNWAY